MKDLKIKLSIGTSRFSTNWTNTEMLFSEFCKKINNPIRTNETIQQYKTYPSKQRSSIKDVGGYIGGWLNDVNRKKDSVTCRSVWTADLDNLYEEVFNNINLYVDFCCVVHSTHSHENDYPRLRLIAPFNRDVTPEEYPIIANYLTNLIDVYGGEATMFDESATRVNQMMYWPSCSVDGEYYYKVIDGNVIDVDHILETIDDNEARFYSVFGLDKKEEPKTTVKKENSTKLVKSQPKHKVVAAYCNAYPINEVLDTVLTKVYSPTNDPNRYTYIKGGSDAGLFVDGGLVYSHHTSDPANTKGVLNAFDLVCLHLYNDIPKNMIEDIIDDPRIKIQLMKDKYKNLNIDIDSDFVWAKDLQFDTSGELTDKVKNAVILFTNDPRYKIFGYNKLTCNVEVLGEVQWERPVKINGWRDTDTIQLKGMLDEEHPRLKDRSIDFAFEIVKDKRAFNPILNYLNGLPEWDRTPRLDTLLINTMKADNTEYVRTVTRKTLVAAVSRIYNPGIKYDNLLVLDGEQGIGKSTLFRTLIGDQYYSNSLSLSDMIDKTAAEKLQGKWIVEIDELSGMRKADIEKVKSFFSSIDDQYRSPYGRRVESHPRQCIIIATVNGERGYLRDITGNRRFWPVKLHQTKQFLNWSFTKEEIDQIWAEAKYYYDNGEKLYLEGDMIHEAEKAQMNAFEVNDSTSIVETYLDRLLPRGWYNSSIEDRRAFLSVDSEYARLNGNAGEFIRDTVSTYEIWCECYCNQKTRISRQESNEIVAILKGLGWRLSKTKKTVKPYGQCWVYMREQ